MEETTNEENLRVIRGEGGLTRLARSGQLFSASQYFYLNRVLRQAGESGRQLIPGLFDFNRLVIRYSLLDAVSEADAKSINDDVSQTILAAGLEPNGRDQI